MTRLVDIMGIGETYATQLKAAGVDTAEELLERGATVKGRADLATATGISGKLILDWVNHVDLMRIKGVGVKIADLLEEAGVDSVAELAQRNAQNLHARLVEVNAAKALIDRAISLEDVSDWIAQAQELPRAVHHG